MAPRVTASCSDGPLRRRCACRASIDIDTPDEPRAVAQALNLHYQHPRHRDWRFAQQLASEKVPGPSVVVRRVA
jgi:hypothetical protein